MGFTLTEAYVELSTKGFQTTQTDIDKVAANFKKATGEASALDAKLAGLSSRKVPKIEAKVNATIEGDAAAKGMLSEAMGIGRAVKGAFAVTIAMRLARGAGDFAEGISEAMRKAGAHKTERGWFMELMMEPRINPFAESGTKLGGVAASSPFMRDLMSFVGLAGPGMDLAPNAATVSGEAKSRAMQALKDKQEEDRKQRRLGELDRLLGQRDADQERAFGRQSERSMLERQLALGRPLSGVEAAEAQASRSGTRFNQLVDRQRDLRAERGKEGANVDAIDVELKRLEASIREAAQAVLDDAHRIEVAGKEREIALQKQNETMRRDQSNEADERHRRLTRTTDEIKMGGVILRKPQEHMGGMTGGIADLASVIQQKIFEGAAREKREKEEDQKKALENIDKNSAEVPPILRDIKTGIENINMGFV